MTTVDLWANAVGAWAAHNDILPLTVYLETIGFAVPAVARQMHDLIAILHFEQAKNRRRARGRPSGMLRQWTDPNYLAARIVEQRIAAWKCDHARQNIPDSEREKIITRTVAEARTWHCAQRKKPLVDRITAILNGPRHRRLPG